MFGQRRPQVKRSTLPIGLCALIVLGVGLLSPSGALASSRPSGVAASPAVGRASSASETAVAVVGGGGHTCALTSAGGVKCWGDNINGELGDGPRPAAASVRRRSTSQASRAASARSVPVTITRAQSRPLAGSKCWGANGAGQLGDGTTTERHTPVDVSGLSSGVDRHRRRRRAYVRAHRRGRGQVLGLEPLRTARRRDDDGPPHTGRRLRSHDRGGRDRRRQRPHLRVDEHRRGQVLGLRTVTGELGDDQACGGLCPTPVDVSGLDDAV